MIKIPYILVLTCLTISFAGSDVRAAEGGYSNYIPGSYGDFGMALAPTQKWTLRNDVYYYDASTNLSLRSGNLEVGADLSFLMNFTTLLYKSDIELFGAQYAAGVFVPLVNLDIDADLSVGDTTVSSSDSGNGALLGDFKADAAGIGPALLWSTKIGDQDVSFIAKWLHEFDAENRLEGDHIFLSFALDW